MAEPTNEDNGVNYGYGVVPYEPPVGYAPGGYLDPTRPVPSGYLNNYAQRAGLEVERQLVGGEVQFNQLDERQKQQFYEQMIRGGSYLTPGNTYKPEALASMDDQFRAYLESKEGSQFKLPGWLKPLEWAGSKMYYVYSNYVSRPIASAILYASQADRGNWDYGDAWDAAKYTSPGQATWMMFMTDDEMRNNGIDPHDIAKSRTAVDSYFKTGIQSYGSGITDFAVSWYADPFVVAFRGIGATRRATFTRSTTRQMEDVKLFGKTFKGKTPQEVTQTGAMTGLTKLVDEYKLKYTPDEAVARLVKEVPSFFKSKNGSGPRLAEALVKATGPDEVNTILRTSLGDYAALSEARNLSAATAARLEAASSKQSMVSMNYATLTDKTTPEAIRQKAQLDKINDEVAGLSNELGTLTRQMDLFHVFDKAYFNSVTTPLGAKMRGMFYDANVAWARKGDKPRKVAGVPLPLGKPSKYGAVTRLVFNGTYVAPLRFVRSMTDDAPIQYIKLDDPESYRAVTALLRDASTLSPSFKAQMTGRYINASQAERPMILAQIEMESVAAMGKRHGLDYTTAMKIYGDFYGRRAAAAGGATYSTAKLDNGMPVMAVDKLGDGSIVVPSPVLVSQMADSWVMMDFKRMDKLMRQQGPAIQRLLREDPNLMDKVRRGAYVAGDRIGGIAETLNQTWKFLQLARAGYGPRAITDEFMGQIAALGVVNFLARTAKGMDNNFFRGNWMRPGRQQQEMIYNASNDLVVQQSQLVDKLERKMAIINERQRNPNINAAKRRELRKEYAGLSSKYDNELETLNQIRVNHAEINTRRTMLEGTEIGGRAWTGALEREGAAFTSHLSAERSIGNAAGMAAGASRRSMITPGNSGWGIVNAVSDEARHTSAWLRAVNNQIRNDELALMRASGATEDRMTSWLATSQGQAYKSKSPFKTMTNAELAERIAAHVDEYLPPGMTGRDVIGQNILARDLTGDELKAALPKEFRPDVHEEQLNYAFGRGGDGGDIAWLADTTMRNFYKVMNQLPAERLSRNPLFASMYRSHLKDVVRSIPEGTYLSPKEYLAYENAARTRALGDVKRLTFNMDYETRLAHSLRFMAPFFGAQMESWTRWARIAADKPQVLPHFVNLYNSPARGGHATTYDGDPIDGYGYATNQVTGEKYKVDKTEAYLNMPVPKAMLNALGSFVGRDINQMRIPVNSLNLVLSGEPAFMPAWGPVVQIPASDFLTGGKLSPFENGQWQHEGFFRELGILPYGPRGDADWWDYINPASGRRLADSEDEFSSKFQSNFAAVMAEEQWKYEEGLRDTAPTLKENLDKARQFTKFEFWANFVLPFSASFQTPQQFYGDMYRKMVREDPQNGADSFRDKFGDSMWMFTAQLSRNNVAMSATAKGAYSSILMQDAVDLADPEFAGDVSHILSGPYATGDWSSGAYYYQLNTPIQTGGTERQREKIGAIEAMAKAKESQGWYQYNKMMLKTQAELYRRGFRSFTEKGAEQLNAERKAAVAVLSDPYNLDGSDNPHYNKEWSEAYNTVDRNKYDRFAASLEKVLTDTLPQALASDGGRSDLDSLYRYLDLRRSVKAELGGRESQNINAKSNADLKRYFSESTMALIERDTRFNELHNRYFTRDMGFDIDEFEED